VLELDAAPLASRLAEGAYDLRLEHTWGVPYDPWISLLARFATPPAAESAASPRHHGVDARVAQWCAAAAAAPSAGERLELAAKVQRLLDVEALVVPLFVPRRLAVSRAGSVSLELDHDLYRLPLARGAGAWQAAGEP
jgi:ABC-type oligopeptide transport system substrate-binding subunit